MSAVDNNPTSEAKPFANITRTEMASLLQNMLLPQVGRVASLPTRLVVMAVIVCLQGGAAASTVETMLKADLKGWAGHGGLVPNEFHSDNLSREASAILGAMYEVLEGDMEAAVFGLCLVYLFRKELVTDYLAIYRRGRQEGK